MIQQATESVAVYWIDILSERQRHASIAGVFVLFPTYSFDIGLVDTHRYTF
jgi:hypothetical protein